MIKNLVIFDSHAHYTDPAFDSDRAALLGSFPDKGIAGCMVCGTQLSDSAAAVALAEQYPSLIVTAVGIHPECPLPPADYLDSLRQLAAHPSVKAIGEIGLDYHWNVYPREVQREAFIKQWELAVGLDLPIEIHSRDAAEDTMNIVRGMYAREQAAGRALRADMHCYSYSPEQAAEYAKMGLYFGIGCVLTFKNATKLREVVDAVPIEQLLLETDCPYLAPEPHRGSRNYSGYLHSVAAKIGEIKGLSEAEVEDITYANARSFFGI